MDRQLAHRLLDELGPTQFAAIANLLEVMVDLDEELTEADRRAVADSRAYFKNNPEGGISLDEMAAECGLTPDEIRNYADQTTER